MPVVEFTVEGPPISHQTQNKRALAAWKGAVHDQASRVYAGLPQTGLLKCTIMHFFEGPDAPMDDDNMVKPIRDAMNGLVYVDDSQIRHGEYAQTSIDERYNVRGVSLVLLSAFHVGNPFIYVRVETAPAQPLLPK